MKRKKSAEENYWGTQNLFAECDDIRVSEEN